jgi:hypothetical protein
MPAKKTATKKTGTAKAKAKVGKVMHEFKQGQLKSGGKKKVSNPKQAIAIGLSEARRAGASIPAKKKSAGKSAPTKKTAPGKAAAKKAPAKKAASGKGSARKTS